jgi:hypothetical protein
MRNANQFLLLLGGAAAGAAIMYVVMREDRDEMLDNFMSFARRTRDNITHRYRDLMGKEEMIADEELRSRPGVPKLDVDVSFGGEKVL